MGKKERLANRAGEGERVGEGEGVRRSGDEGRSLRAEPVLAWKLLEHNQHFQEETLTPEEKREGKRVADAQARYGVD